MVPVIFVMLWLCKFSLRKTTLYPLSSRQTERTRRQASKIMCDYIAWMYDVCPTCRRTLTISYSQYNSFTFRRADSLMKKLKEMQQKRERRTVALEKMVHMVEKNLELTTVRISFQKSWGMSENKNIFDYVCLELMSDFLNLRILF